MPFYKKIYQFISNLGFFTNVASSNPKYGKTADVLKLNATKNLYIG